MDSIRLRFFGFAESYDIRQLITLLVFGMLIGGIGWESSFLYRIAPALMPSYLQDMLFVALATFILAKFTGKPDKKRNQ